MHLLEKTMARTREQVIDLLAKLKDITFERGATLEESKVAAAHVERLLREHNLTAFDVETQTFDEDVVEENLDTDETRLHTWIVKLSSRIGDALNCKVYFRKFYVSGSKPTVRITFIGHEADASVANFLYGKLSVQLYAMATMKGREAGRTSHGLTAYRQIFIVNAPFEIGERLKDSQEMAV